MAKQWRLKGYSVTASNIILQVDYKRDTDVDALPGSAENISYSTGVALIDIKNDLDARAIRKISVYENDETVKKVAEAYLNNWTTVVEDIPV